MKKILGVLTILGLLWAAPAWATVTVENGNGVLIVTLDGSNGFTWSTATITSGLGLGQKVSTYYPNGLQLSAISFYPSAAGAIGQWRDKTATGNLMAPKFYSVDGGPQVMYFTGKTLRKPCLVHADQTTDTSTSWYFIFDTSP